MKKTMMAFLLVMLTAFSYAQCPIEAKRNNGNAGVCESRLQLLFTAMPSTTTIDSIVINGVKQTWTASYIETTTPGGLFQLNYCIPVGNFPPIGVWQIYFGGSNGVPCSPCVDCGGPLAISFTNFKAQRVNPKQIRITFTADDNPDVRRYRVMVSKDGRNFVEKLIIVPASTYTSNYSAIINL